VKYARKTVNTPQNLILKN